MAELAAKLRLSENYFICVLELKTSAWNCERLASKD